MRKQMRQKFPTYQTGNPLNVFKDAEIEAPFRSSGFVKIKPFTEQEAADLRREAEALMTSAETDGSYSNSIDLTSIFAEPEPKRRVHDWVMASVADRCLDHLCDYKVAQAGISRKPARSKHLQAHVAWTLMEDPKTIGVTAWVALEDVDLSKGAMRFMNGAHGMGWPAWGPALPLVVEPYFTSLEADMSTHIVKAGEGFLFDSYLPHGSTANTTDNDRLAVRIQMIPEETEGVIHGASKADPARVDIFPSDAVHLANLSFEQLYGNDMLVEPVGSYRRKDFSISREEFLQAVKHCESIRSGERDLASFSAPPETQSDYSFLRRLRAHAGRIKRRLVHGTAPIEQRSPY